MKAPKPLGVFVQYYCGLEHTDYFVTAFRFRKVWPMAVKLNGSLLLH